MDAGGVVRGLEYWGTRTLPQKMRRQGEWHKAGEYVLIFRLPTFRIDTHLQLLDYAF